MTKDEVNHEWTADTVFALLMSQEDDHLAHEAVADAHNDSLAAERDKHSYSRLHVDLAEASAPVQTLGEWTADYVMYSLATMDKTCAEVIADAHNASIAAVIDKEITDIASVMDECQKLRKQLAALVKVGN